MGAGASFYQDTPVLSSISKVHSAHFADRCQHALRRDQELLERQRLLVGISGFEANAPYAKPLMLEKLERTLVSLDDVGEAHCEDQRRARGHAEVSSAALCNGGVVRICPLADDSTFVCASQDGPMWVFNWREGSTVSEMRNEQAVGKHSGTVLRMCTVSDDCARIATGDDNGVLAVWDLSRPGAGYDIRLHAGAVTGLQCEASGRALFSTSSDSRIMIYDLSQQQVVEFCAPKPCSCGSGIPNTVLGLSEAQRELVLVGGADGKLRVWCRSGGSPMTRVASLSCGGARPSHCAVVSDGWRVVVGTDPCDFKNIVREWDGGTVLSFDLRMLSDDEARGSALLAEVRFDSGVTDMAFIEEQGQVLALCATDGLVRAVDLDGAGVLSQRFVSGVTSDREDSDEGVTAIASKGSFVFAATSAPSVGIWRRTTPTEVVGHEDFVPPTPLPPMVLRARCAPPAWAPAPAAPGAAGPTMLAQVMESLELDRWRLGSEL